MKSKIEEVEKAVLEYPKDKISRQELELLIMKTVNITSYLSTAGYKRLLQAKNVIKPLDTWGLEFVINKEKK
jgi:ribosomal protein S15P/S13E